MLLQPYLHLKEGQPESRRMEQAELGMKEPMMPHKAKMAKERKPTRWNKKLPTKSQQLTQWNPTLMRTLTLTTSCEQCMAKLSTKTMVGI